MALRNVSLDDRYSLLEGEVLLSGIQALVRLPLDQQRRDAARGLRTAGFISGYRGSPLGTDPRPLPVASSGWGHAPPCSGPGRTWGW